MPPSPPPLPNITSPLILAMVLSRRIAVVPRLSEAKGSSEKDELGGVDRELALCTGSM